MRRPCSHGATTTSAEDEPLPPLPIGLAGDYQRDNARVAGYRRGHAHRGFLERNRERAGRVVRWPGRLERIGNFLLDAAHNPDGADALARHLRALALPPERIALVFGTLSDKDWSPMLEALAPLAATRIYVAPANASRSATDPGAMVARHPGRIASSVEEALGAVRAPFPTGSSGPALIVIAGSLVLVGQARALLLGLPRDLPVAL